MKPVSFEEQNCVYGASQPEYQPLPAHRAPSNDGCVTSCWQLGDEDMQELRRNGGKLWVQQLTCGKPLQPQLVSAIKPYMPAVNLNADNF